MIVMTFDSLTIIVWWLFLLQLRVLDPTKLLPALMRYESTRHEEAEVKEKGG